MPTIPATITSWSNADGTGRLRTASGEELRVGASACRGFPPSVGLAVVVLETAPHPLGGLKATAVALPEGADPDALLDAARPLPGLRGDAAALAAFVEETDGIGLLGIIVRAPIADRVGLRKWLARGAVSVEYGAPRRPAATIGGVPFRVEAVNGAVPGGAGVVSFCLPGPFSVTAERTQAIARLGLDGTPVDAVGTFAPLVAAVRALATDEAAVIVHQAPGLLVPASQWIARVDADPLSAWTQVVAGRGAVVLNGLRGLLLPDLFVNGDDVERLAPSLRRAATELVDAARSGRLPGVGDALGGHQVLAAHDDWIRLAPETA
jgi:hypothetical protein